MPPNLTLCLLAKNEHQNLPACLASVRPIAGEIILIDTGSTDGTQTIAAQHQAKVLPFDFTRVDFAAARNYGLQQATGKWILVLDADETLHQAAIPPVQAITAAETPNAYFLERLNLSSESPTINTDYVVRLFPNRPGYRYHGRVHETIDASILAAGGKLLKSDIRIHHKFISSPELRRRKNHWYIEILKEEIAVDPTDLTRLDFLAAEYHQLDMFDEATAIAEQLAKLRPNDARAHLFAAAYHLLFKPNLAQARADLTRALELQPHYPEAESFFRLLHKKEKESSPPSA